MDGPTGLVDCRDLDLHGPHLAAFEEGERQPPLPRIVDTLSVGGNVVVSSSEVTLPDRAC